MAHKINSDTLELIESRLHELPEEKLPVVLDFVEFLSRRNLDSELREAMMLAQPLLAGDWLSAEEDEAWKDI